MDLIAGHGEALWPRPGRVFAASRSHTFAQLATAIDDAFARWDRSHLHEFTRADGYRLGILSDEDYDPEHLLDYRRVTLGRLSPGEQFAYVFDFGDQWEHLCTVGPRRVDPLETLGVVPDQPLQKLGPPVKGGDNMLKIASDAREAALDMRLVRPGASERASGKLNLAADEIAAVYRDTAADRGVQLVFLDLGTPKTHDAGAAQGADLIVIEADMPISRRAPQRARPHRQSRPPTQ